MWPGAVEVGLQSAWHTSCCVLLEGSADTEAMPDMLPENGVHIVYSPPGGGKGGGDGAGGGEVGDKAFTSKSYPDLLTRAGTDVALELAVVGTT